MTYDGLDNLLTYNVGGRRQSYQINGNQQLETVYSPPPGAQTLVELAYDARGNTTQRTAANGTDVQNFTYNLRNQVLTATRNGVTVQRHQYDGHGMRTINTRANDDFRYDVHDAGNQRSWSAEFFAINPTQRQKQTNYIHLGGSLIAKYIFELAPGTVAQRVAGDTYTIVDPFPNARCGANRLGCAANDAPRDAAGNAVNLVETTKVVYVHTDALGSPVAESDEYGQIINRTYFEPYGNPLNTPTVDNEPSYTGHAFDTTTGLVYAQARYYDPQIGRFLSVDPMATDTSSASNFNRYAYANNSPYRFIDPDGREAGMFQRREYRMAQPDAATTATALGLAADFTPVIGDIKGFAEAFQTPTFVNFAAATVGLVPGIGDVAGKALKHGDEAGGFLVRFGKGPETADGLAADAAKAEAAGYPHGVSTRLKERVSGSDKDHRSAARSEVESHFQVEQTGGDKRHHTVSLPKPVTQDVADKFNTVFAPK